jgi:hypothetical protein
MRREDEIRLIAYALWVRDGKRYWKAIEHWLRAEVIWEQNQKILDQLGRSDEELDKVSLAAIR